MSVNMIKRMYYLPENLVDHFSDFQAPSKEYSPSVAGSLLIWMALDANVREKAKQLSHQEDIKKSISEIQNFLKNYYVDLEKDQILSKLNSEQKDLLIQIAKEASGRLSRKR